MTDNEPAGARQCINYYLIGLQVMKLGDQVFFSDDSIERAIIEALSDH